MSDEGDLVGKADTLLARYRGSKGTPEPDFPLLTEVVVDAGAVSHDQIPEAAGPAREGAGFDAHSDYQAAERLKLQLQEALNASLKQALHQGLEARLAQVARDLRLELDERVEASVRDAVARAIEDVLNQGPAAP